MGKKKVALVDLSLSDKAELKASGVRSQKINFKAKKSQEPEPMPIEPVEQAAPAAAETKTDTAKPTKKRIKQGRSKRYLESKTKLKNEAYPLDQAVSLLKEIAKVKFDPSVELHLNLTVSKVSGELQLPHGTGKTLRVEIASEKTIIKLNDNKLDFDVLIAEPKMMAKLAKYAKILGPKGLMPNPKNGTISDNPEAAAKKFAGGLTHFKSEPKAPLMHLVVGKLSFKNEQLVANLAAAIASVQPKNISAAFLCASMSPSIRLVI
ncbi:MAG: hypothetical protein U1C50_03510 [Patescibacteria group bacterium]|nr:hypothetical protein [Candidatus Beckwithbacteria bacterium]MDZ4229293.1 hypothetical protein [Patescibacteria group bacterium]